MMTRLRKLLPRLYCIAALCLCSIVGMSQASDPANKVKAYYLLHFCKHISWQDEASQSSFKIAIIGNEDLAAELKSLVDSFPVKGKPTTITTYSQFKNIEQADLVYLSSYASRGVDKVYDALKDTKTLLVSDNADQVYMINFNVSDGVQVFSLDNEILAEAGFQVSSKLLVIGGSELEVLQLFEASQSSLDEERKRLEAAQAEIEEREKRIGQLRDQIIGQESTIEALDERRLTALLEAKVEEALMEQQRAELATLLDELKGMQSSLSAGEQERNKRGILMLQLEAEYKLQQGRIADNKTVLEQQQQQLANQQEDLADKENTIESQGQVLTLSLTFLGVVLLMAYLIYREYRHKKKANAIIASQAELVALGARQKEDFLANMSHEIRTPMNAIVGFTNLMLKLPLPGKQEEYLENIKISSRNLLNIISDILDLSKIEAGKIDIERIHFDLPKILKNVVTTLQVAADEKNIELALVDFTAPDYVVGDPTRLSQVLMNLLANAIKFTPTGKVEIEVKRSTKTADNVEVQFVVRDTGIGISPEKIDEIFEKFTQSDQSITRRYGGTGLGLPISKRLVELLGGSLELTSEVDKGSEFFFTLLYPVGDESEVNREMTDEINIHGIEKMRIVLADDYEINRHMTTELFRQWNHEVEFETVANGQELVDLMKVNPADVVLMDVHMPIMDGIVATEKLRNEMKSEVVIIGLSANALKRDKDQCLAAGMNDYVTKPFELNQVLTKIAQHLGLDMNIVEIEQREHQPLNGKSRIINLNRIYKMSQDVEEVKDLVVGLLEDIPFDIENLKGNLQSADYPEIQRHAHSLVNKAFYVGSNAFGTQCREMEEMARKAADKTEMDALMNEMEEGWGSIQTALLEHIESLET
jgi:signal transduction histidine kinase/DNA-binding NarL/FixJ family response regulator